MDGKAHAAGETHVIVIGAGVTGLLIAQGLKKAGIDFSIFEAESQATYRPREWSMGIHWSLPQLERLLPADLSARLNEAQNDPFFEHGSSDVLPIINGINGKVMKQIPVSRQIRVSRRKMRAFCAQDIDVQYGKTLKDISYGANGNEVTAIFTDGETRTGSLLIGSDGPRSVVRDLLFDSDEAKVTMLKIIHANIAVRYNDAERAKFVRSAHPIFSMVTHPDCFCFIAIQDVPDPDKPETWRFQVVTSWLGERDSSMDNEARLRQVKEKASRLCEPFKSANLWMPDDTLVTYDPLGYWSPVARDSKGGRVTLAGDAAHAMTPHRGQGLNHAICDVEHLVDAIQKIDKGEKTPKEAITIYDEEVIPRGTAEVKASIESCYGLLDWNNIMNSPILKVGLEKGGTAAKEEHESVAQKNEPTSQMSEAKA